MRARWPSSAASPRCFAARRRKTTKFEDSIISGTDIKTNTVFGSTGGGVVNTGDNSLASDFSREGLGNIDTDEVDPIAEAEVYLAYGRDAQAEEILKDALKKDPQRQEIYLKLLEIHAQHNKPSAFETVASELYAVTSGQGEVWHEGGGARPPARSRTIRCSPKAARRSPRPAGGRVELAPRTDARPALAMPRRRRRRASISRWTRRSRFRRRPARKPKTPADILAGAEAELEKTAQGCMRRDFDPDTHDGAARRGCRQLPAPVAAGKSSLETVHDRGREGDIGDGQGDRRRQNSISTSSSTTSTSRRRWASRASSPCSRPRQRQSHRRGAPAQLARPAAALELDKLDLSFDPERTTFEDPTPSVLDGQWHDAATKLDLAKAYQEMGDVEGAREILQEVLHEGDDQQKAEAKSLLAKLG